jgi:hypothetical protein
MAKSALITLTTAGADTGPFNLLSDVNSYVTPFETNIAKSSLVAGYTTNLVPDAATIIRLQSTNSFCTNYINLTYPTTTTTTTTSTTSTTTTAAPTTTTSTTTTTTTEEPTTTTSTTTTTTTEEPTTTTSTTTTTTTAIPCYNFVATADQTDIDNSDNGTVYFEYIDCNGDPQTLTRGTTVPSNDICARSVGTVYILVGGNQSAAGGSLWSGGIVQCN